MATTAPTEKVGEFNSPVVGERNYDTEKRSGSSPSDSVDGVRSGVRDGVTGYDSDDTETHVQAGVKRVEALTTVQTKATLWTMFGLFYLVSFVDMLLVSMQYSLNAYVTSDFSSHGLLASTGIVATIVGGTSTFTIAKIIDIWGRVEGFVLMVTITMIGIIMKCVCKNVETYAAAHTFYWVGHLGVLYVIDITLADMTTLRNRMIILTVNATPTIATTFAGPRLVELFLANSTFRWAFGAFGIMLVGVSLPAAVILFLNQRKAYRAGLIKKERSGRTLFQSLKFYFIEFDVVGILLVTACFSLFLLPFNLYSGARGGWKNASMIAMIVVGILCGVFFVIYEKFIAPVQFFPFRYLKERTIISSCILYGVMFLSIFVWDTYYFSYLQVVHDLSITHAGYILNTFSLASTVFSPLVAWAIRSYGNIKHITYVGVPFVVLGTTLLLHFRVPSSNVGYLAMCQIFMGIGTGIFATTAQLAIMASVTHQEIAVAVALWSMFGSIGASIGQAIAGALWTSIVPTRLFEALPEESKNLTMTIYSSLSIQQEYPMGSPIRDALIVAYADVQRKMVIAGSAFLPVMLISIVFWKSINVKKMEAEHGKQTKGTVW